MLNFHIWKHIFSCRQHKRRVIWHFGRILHPFFNLPTSGLIRLHTIKGLPHNFFWIHFQSFSAPKTWFKAIDCYSCGLYSGAIHFSTYQLLGSSCCTRSKVFLVIFSEFTFNHFQHQRHDWSYWLFTLMPVWNISRWDQVEHLMVQIIWQLEELDMWTLSDSLIPPV